MALAVDGDVLAIPAVDERRVDEARARWVQLRNEDVAHAPCRERSVEGARGRRKIGGPGASGDIGVAARVDGDALPLFTIVPSEVGRVCEVGIDHQRIARVVATEGETIAPALSREREATGHGDPPPADSLIASGRRLGEVSERRPDREPSCASNGEALCPLVGEADVADVCARVNDELVLERSRRSPKSHVDPGPEVAVHDPPIRRKAGVAAPGPIQVVDLSASPLARLDTRARICPEEPKMKCDAFPAIGKSQHRLVLREVEAEAGSMRVVANGLARLAAIRYEGQWKLAVAL